MKLNIIDPIYALGSTAPSYVSSVTERGDNIISIGCGTPENSYVCKVDPDTVAYAEEKDNSIILCPSAFTRSGFYGQDSTEQYAQLQWGSHRLMRPSGGFYLLHEMTHLPSLVGGFKHWSAAPVDASHDFYYTPNE
ncbi:hypothetical protein LZ32DRAFT_459863 [Colletotrichum eremochloae]|nr:hypothetical protein LZ32DRAFT_459863 [Colletotrichum eremochloae]